MTEINVLWTTFYESCGKELSFFAIFVNTIYNMTKYEKIKVTCKEISSLNLIFDLLCISFKLNIVSFI